MAAKGSFHEKSGVVWNSVDSRLIGIAVQVFIKIVLGKQVDFNVTDGFVQGVAKLMKIFLVEVNFGFNEVSIIKFTPLAFGDGNVIVAVAGGLYIKKIGAFTCPDSFGEYFLLSVLMILVHKEQSVKLRQNKDI